jgi:hypothetical protein
MCDCNSIVSFPAAALNGGLLQFHINSVDCQALHQPHVSAGSSSPPERRCSTVALDLPLADPVGGLQCSVAISYDEGTSLAE